MTLEYDRNLMSVKDKIYLANAEPVRLRLVNRASDGKQEALPKALGV